MSCIYNREDIHETLQFVHAAVTITVNVESSSQTVWLAFEQLYPLFEEEERIQISSVAKNATEQNVITVITRSFVFTFVTILYGC